MKILLFAGASLAVAVALSGCASAGLDKLLATDTCTTKVAGKMAFGSITPTGDINFSATCVKPPAPGATAAPAPATPPAPTTPPAPGALGAVIVPEAAAGPAPSA